MQITAKIPSKNMHHITKTLSKNMHITTKLVSKNMHITKQCLFIWQCSFKIRLDERRSV